MKWRTKIAARLVGVEAGREQCCMQVGGLACHNLRNRLSREA